VAASKVNYIIVYDNHSQVYGCSSKKIALESPPPEGSTLKDKKVFFITLEPDTQNLAVYKLDQDEVLGAEIKEKKEKKTANE
jgi:hypothetical protein